jgi:hypothetical protein
MFALPDVINLFPDEFTGLSGGRFVLTLVASRSLQCLLLWHGTSTEIARLQR